MYRYSDSNLQSHGCSNKYLSTFLEAPGKIFFVNVVLSKDVFVQWEDSTHYEFPFPWYRGILCSYPSHTKSKSSLSRKMNSSFFTWKSVTPNNGRVGCTVNQDKFPLNHGILLSLKNIVKDFFLVGRLYCDKFDKIREFRTGQSENRRRNSS